MDWYVDVVSNSDVVHLCSTTKQNWLQFPCYCKMDCPGAAAHARAASDCCFDVGAAPQLVGTGGKTHAEKTLY